MKHLRRFNERVTHNQQLFYDEYKRLLKSQDELLDAEEGEEYQDDELEGMIWDLIEENELEKASVAYILQHMDTSFDQVSFAETKGFLQRIYDEWEDDSEDIKSEWEKEFGDSKPSNQEKVEWYHQMRNKGYNGIEIYNTLGDLMKW